MDGGEGEREKTDNQQLAEYWQYITCSSSKSGQSGYSGYSGADSGANREANWRRVILEQQGGELSFIVAGKTHQDPYGSWLIDRMNWSNSS
jgi:hypothetical protein